MMNGTGQLEVARILVLILVLIIVIDPVVDNHGGRDGCPLRTRSMADD
jgi:hypothetical protein